MLRLCKLIKHRTKLLQFATFWSFDEKLNARLYISSEPWPTKCLALFLPGSGKCESGEKLQVMKRCHHTVLKLWTTRLLGQSPVRTAPTTFTIYTRLKIYNLSIFNVSSWASHIFLDISPPNPFLPDAYSIDFMHHGKGKMTFWNPQQKLWILRRQVSWISSSNHMYKARCIFFWCCN